MGQHQQRPIDSKPWSPTSIWWKQSTHFATLITQRVAVFGTPQHYNLKSKAKLRYFSPPLLLPALPSFLLLSILQGSNTSSNLAYLKGFQENTYSHSFILQSSCPFLTTCSSFPFFPRKGKVNQIKHIFVHSFFLPPLPFLQLLQPCWYSLTLSAPLMLCRKVSSGHSREGAVPSKGAPSSAGGALLLESGLAHIAYTEKGLDGKDADFRDRKQKKQNKLPSSPWDPYAFLLIKIQR